MYLDPTSGLLLGMYQPIGGGSPLSALFAADGENVKRFTPSLSSVMVSSPFSSANGQVEPNFRSEMLKIFIENAVSYRTLLP